MTTEEGNILIAKFMGVKTTVYSDTPTVTRWQYGNNMLYESDMKYHSSWDWLMPVVERINNDGKFEIIIECSGNSTNKIVRCYIVRLAWVNNRPDNEEICARSSAKHSLIEIVYITILDFIQWYNSYISNQQTK